MKRKNIAEIFTKLGTKFNGRHFVVSGPVKLIYIAVFTHAHTNFPAVHNSRHFWQVVDVVNSFRYLFLTYLFLMLT